MRDIFKGIYRINNVTSQLYIDAIAVFHGSLPIEIRLADRSTFSTVYPHYCRDLPAIIFELHQKGITEFNFYYTAINGNSIDNVFPNLNFPADFVRAHSAITLLEAQSAHDDAFDKNTAIAIISKMHGFSAVDLPDLQSIVFRNKQGCHYITYGDASHIKAMQFMQFDIDDGFIYKSESDGMGMRICAELQKFFLAWKANNYQGKPIPGSAALTIQSQELTVANTPAVLDEIDIMKDAIAQACLSNAMSPAEKDAFLSRIVSACVLCNSWKPMRTIHNRVIQNLSLSVIVSFDHDQSIAFFKLAYFGVTPEVFSQYRRFFIPEYKGSPSLLDEEKRTVDACAYLLSSGMAFEVAMRHIIDIKKMQYRIERFIEIANGLSANYAKKFTEEQLRFYKFLREHNEKRLEISVEQISELILPRCTNFFKLRDIMYHLLITKHEPWANVVGIINGVNFRTRTADFFGKNNLPTAEYISKILYGRMLRDQAREALTLPSELLGDECSWFDNEIDVKALIALVRDQGLNPVMAISELSTLNSSQKNIILVGGNIDEAKEMYISRGVVVNGVFMIPRECIPDFSQGTDPLRDSLRDLQEFRQSHAQNNAAVLGVKI